MYFSDKPISPSKHNPEEYERVQSFKNKYKDRGLYFSYSTTDQFKELFFAHLSQHFLSKKRVDDIQNERRSALKLVGIDSNHHIVDFVPVIDFVPNVNVTTVQFVDSIRRLINEIASIKVERKAVQPEVSTAFSTLSISLSKPVEIEDNIQKMIRAVAEKLDIELPDDFFQLGNLSTNVFDSDLITGRKTYTGTDDEKQKFYTIKKLFGTIDQYNQWSPIESAFSKKCMCLALTNCGTSVDEDVEIALRIPCNGLLQTKSFPQLNNHDKFFILNECNMREMFRVCGSSEYSNYTRSRKQVARQPSKKVYDPLLSISTARRKILCKKDFASGRLAV